jgi:hypothetical protein
MTQVKKMIGLGMCAVVSFLLVASVASAAVSSATTTYTPLTATELLQVTTGTSIGDVAGLGDADLRTTIAQIIRVILAFLGVVAVIIIIWGGFKWMVSGGADEKVRDARKLIVMGIVGLAIVLSAYAIASFVISSLASATGLR